MDLADPLIGLLASGIERRALLEVVLLGGACGALGYWVVAFRLAYPAESLAHGLLPGLVLATLAGLPLLLGAAGGVAVAAVAIALAARDERIGAQTATAVVISGMFGLGALLALSPEAPARLGELLFGDPLGVADGDLLAATALLGLTAAALTAGHRPLAVAAFDPAGAASVGVSAGAVRLALLALLAIALSVAVAGLGSLLVLATLVGPALATHRLGVPPRLAAPVSGAIAVAAGTVGMYASSSLGTAAGASVALASCASVALVAVAQAVRGGSGPRSARTRPTDPASASTTPIT